MILLVIILFLIISEAIYEALYDEGKKTLSGLVEFFYRAVVTVMALLWLSDKFSLPSSPVPLWKLIGGFIFIRYALFDLTYNLIRKLPWFYIGQTKIFDKVWNWFFRKTMFPVGHFLWLTKFILLLIGIAWLLNL